MTTQLGADSNRHFFLAIISTAPTAGSVGRMARAVVGRNCLISSRWWGQKVTPCRQNGFVGVQSGQKGRRKQSKEGA